MRRWRRASPNCCARRGRIWRKSFPVVVGDVRRSSNWQRRSRLHPLGPQNGADHAAANVSEYLQEESRDLVTRTELEEFLSGVDELRESTDRLAARMAHSRRGPHLMKLRVILRLLEIQRVLVSYGLDDFVRATHLYRPLRFFFYLSPSVWLPRDRGLPRGVRLRLALEDLGLSL